MQEPEETEVASSRQVEVEPAETEKKPPEIAEASSSPDSQPEQQEIVPEKEEVIITPGQRKKKVIISKLTVEETKEKKVEVEDAQPEPTPLREKKANVRDGDALFNERVKATSTWLAWAYRGGYTIQLMVLASENAEENLKKILADEKFYEIRENLYVLKKRSRKTFYLFNGNYPDMGEARKARNAMPPFLKEIHPYALSIQDALKKTQAR